MLGLTPRQYISLPDAAKAVPQHVDLLRLQTYLDERLAVGELLIHADPGLDLLFDVDYLGRCNVEENQSISPRDADLVYALRLYHSDLLFGPLYRPASSTGPCPHCLERNWQALRMEEEQSALYNLERLFVYGSNPRLTPFTLEQIWQVIVMTLDQALHTEQAQVQGSPVYRLNLDSFQLEQFFLLQDPLCPQCATPGVDIATELHLVSREKPDINTFHLVNALDYKLPVDSYINPICGCLGAIAYNDLAHTLTSPASGLFWLKGRHGLRKGWWGGHGNSYRSSLALGLLEALERYAGFRPRARQQTVYDSYEHLAPGALDPRTCGLYRPEVYAAAAPHLTPFRDDLLTHWVWGFSLLHNQPLLVPEQMVYYLDYRTKETKNQFLNDNSNGCATGSTMEEAIFFGLLELIERDAFLISWYARLALPRIDPWSSQNQQTLSLLDRMDRLGYEVYLLDARLDLPIPVVIAVAVRRDERPGKLLLAAGASFDPEDAIRGALCEVGAYMSGFDYRVEKKMELLQHLSQDVRRVSNLEEHALLYGLPEMLDNARFLYQNPQVLPIEEAYRQWNRARPENLDLLADLQYCLQLVQKLKMDVIVVDQSCPQEEQVGLKTACVIVPGLMPITFGYYRERAQELPRLRTVPRTAGFLEKDFDPALMNTIPHPFP
jgi:ribosomal protein S12 methylthiotransferase accessory factor